MDNAANPPLLTPRPPAAPFVMPPPSQEGLLKTMLSRGFEVFRRAWLALFVATVLMIAIQIPVQVLSFIVNLATMPQQRQGATLEPEFAAAQIAVMAITFVYGLLVTNPFVAGAVVMAARVARGQGPDWGDLASGFRRYGSVMATGLLQVLISMLVALAIGMVAATALALGAFASGSTTAIVVLIPVALLAIVASIFVSARLAFSMMRAADPMLAPISPPDAIGASWRLTRGHVLALFIGFVVAGLLAALSLLLLCVGYILVGVPLLLAIIASAYDELIRREVAQGSAPSPSSY